MQKFELNSFTGADELAGAVAGKWLDEVELSLKAGKSHCVALSGGRITLKFFAAVVAQARARAVSFTHVHFFWADERCVPPTDAENNFRAAQELLFAPLNIANANIHRIAGELPAQNAAAQAIAEISQIAPPNAEGQPVLNLIFLGMGEDGHVASLFPGAPADILNASTPFVVIEDSPKPPPTRISLSYQAIAAAGRVWVLASGAGKTGALHESLMPTGKTPLGRVIQSRSRTIIFTDIQPE